MCVRLGLELAQIGERDGDENKGEGDGGAVSGAAATRIRITREIGVSEISGLNLSR